MIEISPSHAQDIRAKLANSGVATHDITLDHLLPVYKGWQDRPAIAQNMCAKIDGSKHQVLPLDVPMVAVIVETRKNFNLCFSINQIRKFLNVPIQLFHGPGNLDFIMKSNLNKLVKSGDLILTPLASDNLNAAAYNQLFLTKPFWNSLIGRQKILVFQTDSILCKRSDFTIQEFFNFDYIGSDWNRAWFCDFFIDGGNGGLSLRDWQKSVETITRFPTPRIDFPEDIFFAFHIELIGGKVGKPASCDRFSSQDQYHQRSFGAHKMHHMTQLERIRFLAYCPSAWRILPRVRQIGCYLDKLIKR